MLNILIGIPSTREDKRFLESLDNFLKELDSSGRYEYKVLWQRNMRLKDAQNVMAKRFINGDYSYLLMLDDDHWGHKIEMLDCLIDANSYMATIKSYSRHYPYFSCLMNKRPADKLFVGIEYGEGYIPCEMTGFSMTLFKRELFEKILEYPFFEEEVECERDWVTDTVFCRKLVNLGIKPMGCFQYCLPHDHITQENVMQLRSDHGVRGDNYYWKMIFDKYVNKGENLCMAHQ